MDNATCPPRLRSTLGSIVRIGEAGATQHARESSTHTHTTNTLTHRANDTNTITYHTDARYPGIHNAHEHTNKHN